MTIHPASLPPRPKGDAWHLMVDLSVLRPGGENGGVKPFIFEYLGWLMRHEGERLTITFLTWSWTHDEVRNLARPTDNLICVRHQAPSPPTNIRGWRAREWLYINPPPTLAIEVGADLIYSPFGSPEFLCPGVPSIATVVDLLHMDYPASLPSSAVSQRRQVFEDMCRRVDAFQCISDFTAKQLHQHYSVPRERIFRSYIAVHDRLDRWRQDINSTSDSSVATKPYFLYPANSWRHKNHLTLLVAFRLYRHRVGADAWDLVLTGHDDEGMRQILASAKVLGIADCVHYHGHMAEREFSELWARAGGLVFPSLHEGFGIPLVEAMHLRVPIVCSSETSLPEIAGDAALIVDARNPEKLAEAIERLASDETLRSDLVNKGLQQLTRFSIEQEGRTFLKVCTQLIGTAGATYYRGWYPDGWTDPIACFALPRQQGSGGIELIFAPMPVARTVRLYLGKTPLGGYQIDAAKPASIRPKTTLTTGTLTLHTVDATNLSPSDHRTHGVLLQEIRFTDSEGGTQVLTPSLS